jgi:trans-aconitate methyltransferase
MTENHPQCKRAVGIDISPRMIWKAEHCWPVPSNTSFFACDLMEYNASSPFDIVFSFAVLYYIIPMETMKTKLDNWLKPGGMFVAGTDYYIENEECHCWSDMMAIT